MAKRPSVVAPGLLARPGSAPARSTPIEDMPRSVPTSAPAAAVSRAAAPTSVDSPQDLQAGGIKAATRGLTVYLLPDEHKRLRRFALDLDVPSLHELLLMGVDRLLVERGEAPIRRYAPKPKKG